MQPQRTSEGAAKPLRSRDGAAPRCAGDAAGRGRPPARGRGSSCWIGRLVLFGYTWALMHHMLGGIRHLIWDNLVGLEPGEREWLATANLYGSIALTIAIWVVVYMFTGGLRS